MDKLLPRRLTREQLSRFLGSNPELIRAFEAFIEALSTAIPDELAGLQLSAAASAAMVEALTSQAEDDRRDNEAARMLALSAQVQQLAERLNAPQDDSALLALSGQLAQLTEQVAYMGGMKRKRVISGSISITAGNSSGTFTISPALSSLDMADLRFLGFNHSTDANGSTAQTSIELTSTTTVTARRTTTGNTTTAYFQITEYTQ